MVYGEIDDDLISEGAANWTSVDGDSVLQEEIFPSVHTGANEEEHWALPGISCSIPLTFVCASLTTSRAFCHRHMKQYLN